MKRLAISLSTLSFLMALAHGECYAPNGDLETNPEYVPCSNDTSNALSSICCTTNRADGADICVENGLCQVGRKSGSPPKAAEYTKPQCTHSNSDDPGCLQVCEGQNLPFLTPCEKSNSSLRWCCGLSDECCNTDRHLPIETLAARFGDPVPSSTLSADSTPTATLTPSTIILSTSPLTSGTLTSLTSNPAASSSSLSGGAKAGIGIGTTLGALVLIGLGIWLGRFLHAQKSQGEKIPPQELYGGNDGSFYGASAAGNSELPMYKAREEERGKGAPMVEAGERDPTELP